MEEQKGNNPIPFSLKPVEIWENLSQQHRKALVTIYEINELAETAESQRLKQGKQCRPPDNWRWVPFKGNSIDELTPLEARLNESGISGQEAYKILYALEDLGLVRCWQDLWAADTRFFVRILFLGQRVVRDGIYADPFKLI